MLDAGIELLSAEGGFVQLLSGKSGTLKIVAQRGFGAEHQDPLGDTPADGESVCGRALSSGERIIIEDVHSDDGEPFRAQAHLAGFRSLVLTPLVGADGTAIGILSTYFRDTHRPTDHDLRRLDLYVRQATDFIQRCRMEQVLRQNEESLREADRRKDQFLALLAHELRNPLAPIRYALATARKAGRTPEQQKRSQEVVERQVAHMSRLLDDLLDVSRITRGILELKKSWTELTSVLGAAIEAARPILDNNNHSLTLDLPRQAVRLEADPVRLAQVFSNLLINAAKYTDRGGQIHLRATHEGGEVVVSVRDNGIGISAETMPKLFTLFSQAPAAVGRSEGGLGVGLALVRGLVTLHGGYVEAHSEGVNRGSEFIVRLPAIAPAQEPRRPEETAPGPSAAEGLRILVVDDNRDAADTCAALLEVSGHEVQTAYTGARALELAADFRPHVCLLDIGLPDVDGYQVAQRLRTTPPGRDAMLVAVTGWGQKDDRRRAFAAGFDHHLTKPIAPETLEALLAAVSSGRGEPAPD
jgi:signal transduction histidine kinase/CheY-like chemotaxis protein